MQLTPRQFLVQFAHVLQQELFPVLREVAGPLNPQLELLASVILLAPVERLLSAGKAATGRPAKRPGSAGNGLHRQSGVPSSHHAQSDIAFAGG